MVAHRLGTDQYLVVWGDRFGLYVRLVNWRGRPLGTAIPLLENPYGYYSGSPMVVANPDNDDFLIVWVANVIWGLIWP